MCLATSSSSPAPFPRVSEIKKHSNLTPSKHATLTMTACHLLVLMLRTLSQAEDVEFVYYPWWRPHVGPNLHIVKTSAQACNVMRVMGGARFHLNQAVNALRQL